MPCAICTCVIRSLTKDGLDEDEDAGSEVYLVSGKPRSHRQTGVSQGDLPTCIQLQVCVCTTKWMAGLGQFELANLGPITAEGELVVKATLIR